MTSAGLVSFGATSEPDERGPQLFGLASGGVLVAIAELVEHQHEEVDQIVLVWRLTASSSSNTAPATYSRVSSSSPASIGECARA